MLSQDRFRAARAFVEDGRPLDAALLRLALGGGSGEAVCDALAAFQNPDGGFGHGLEPDIPSPASSALATSIGLRLLRRVGAGNDHPMVGAAIGWLGGALDRAAGVWPIIDAGVDLAPHAPWWAFSDELAASWNGFRFNPSAEILAHLYSWRAAAPAGLIETAEAALRRTLDEIDMIDGAYDLKCAVRLIETPAAPADLRRRLMAVIAASIAAHDPADEHANPLDLAPTPYALLAGLLRHQTAAALDALIAAQDADGGWTPFWDWSFVDAAAWDRARRDWRVWLTREALETLRAYGRVEAA